MAGVNTEMRDELSTSVEHHYHDQVTAVCAAEHAIAHSAPERDRVLLRNCQSGHAPYTVPDSRGAIARDLRAFIRHAVR